MRWLLITSALALSPTLSDRAAAYPANHARSADAVAHPHCQRLYRVAHAKRTARQVYAGTRRVSAGDRRELARELRCQRNPMARGYVRWFYGLEARAHARRVYLAAHPPLSYATASWYDDAGATASGYHAYYGVAVCGSGGGPCVPFGTRIRFVYHGRSVTAIADDHGPYVAGRAFDLNQNTARALGFSGVDTVGYHID